MEGRRKPGVAYWDYIYISLNIVTMTLELCKYTYIA